MVPLDKVLVVTREVFQGLATTSSYSRCAPAPSLEKGDIRKDMETATLISGYTEFESEDLVGLSVASIRSRYGSTFNIPTGARATMNGVVAAEEATLGVEDTLVFDAPTGTKG